jgi:hypothetical protein
MSTKVDLTGTRRTFYGTVCVWVLFSSPRFEMGQSRLSPHSAFPRISHHFIYVVNTSRLVVASASTARMSATTENLD